MQMENAVLSLSNELHQVFLGAYYANFHVGCSLYLNCICVMSFEGRITFCSPFFGIIHKIFII